MWRWKVPASIWKPLYNLLEATGLTAFVVNAAHMKAVPGRKTDVQDAMWVCDLMRYGLLKPSFIPPRPQRELRELVRYRISLIRERGDEANRIQKVLEGGNSAPGQNLACPAGAIPAPARASHPPGTESWAHGGNDMG